MAQATPTMPGRTDPLTALALLGARHHGVVTLADARALGVTRAQLRTATNRGTWRSAGRGVLVATASPRSWRQRVMIAVAASGGAASHRCSARLHRIDGFADAPVEITVHRNGSTPTGDLIVHRTRHWDPASITEVDGMPTMSIARTLVDLGAVVDDDQVEQALDDVMRRGYNLRWIAGVLDSAMRPGPSGCAALQRVLARPDRDGPIPDSRFERLVERLLTAHGLPAPERQVPIRSGDQIVAWLDAGWLHARVGLEADSELWHWGPRRGRLARARHNLLSSLGWTMLYASWQDLDDPSDLLARLHDLLGPSGQAA